VKKPNIPNLYENTPFMRREILKQRRLSIERGEIKANNKMNRTLFRLEDARWLQRTVGIPIKLMGLYAKGRQNARNIEIKEVVLEFPNLPPSFEGFRLLHLSDLHLDCDEQLLDFLLQKLSGIRADLCILTGDYRFKLRGNDHPALKDTLHLVDHLKKNSHLVFAVLGNHDSFSIGEGLEKAGVEVLFNRAKAIRKNGEEIWVAGVDDPHYYACHDLDLALDQVPSQAFKVFLAHSPVLYQEASNSGIHLYLCGHTHGGQIRLPGIGAIVKNTPTPRRYIDGLWKHNGMVGLTHRGVGSSILPLRFGCPPEIWTIELRRAKNV
jgi:predicted MPP superfamily phosphohydrolase